VRVILPLLAFFSLPLLAFFFFLAFTGFFIYLFFYKVESSHTDDLETVKEEQ